MRKTVQNAESKRQKRRPRPSRPALLLLSVILEKIVFRFDDLEQDAAEASSLLELIQHNPGLKPETEALRNIIEGEEYLRGLRADLDTIE